MDELQRELGAPQSRHTIAERSEHFIQRQQPQFVWVAVRDMVVALAREPEPNER